MVAINNGQIKILRDYLEAYMDAEDDKKSWYAYGLAVALDVILNDLEGDKS